MLFTVALLKKIIFQIQERVFQRHGIAVQAQQQQQHAKAKRDQEKDTKNSIKRDQTSVKRDKGLCKTRQRTV